MCKIWIRKCLVYMFLIGSLLENEEISRSDAVTPQISVVSLKTCQPAETCGYRVPRYRIHMSHLSRLIPAYLIHNVQKYMIDYNHSLLTVPLIPKRCTCFGSARIEYKTKTKQNKTKSYPALIPYAVPYVGQPLALDLYLKGGSHNMVNKAL